MLRNEKEYNFLSAKLSFWGAGERELGSEGMAAVLAGVMICIWVFVQRIILIEEPSPAHSPQPSPAQTTVSRAIQPADSQPWEPGLGTGLSGI